MLRAAEGIGVLLLLSMFFAYLLAPVVAALRRRVRAGRRNRPVSRATALLLLYLALFGPATLVWRVASDGIAGWVHVTAPQAVDRLFSGANLGALDAAIRRAPVSPALREALRDRADQAAAYLERETRSTLHDLIDAAPHALWLAAVPVAAFLLLTVAPGFQRSALRLLPHGHVQWRAEQYARDVNSTLAAYVRAQSAAAVTVGILCVAGFALIGVPSAVSMGVAAGVLELVPAVGPAVAMLMAVTQSIGLALPVFAFLAALRLLQDYVIYPRLVRRGMRLPTFAVIVTIWIGAALAGAAGVILAIPVAGLISVSWRHWREYRDIERFIATYGRGV